MSISTRPLTFILLWTSPHLAVTTGCDFSSSCVSTSSGNALLQSAAHMTKTPFRAHLDPPVEALTELPIEKFEQIGNQNQRCRGRPPGGWGNLGRNLNLETCKAKCLSKPSCKFLTHKERRGVCSYFASCSRLRHQNGFTTWAKGEPTPKPTEPPTEPPTVPKPSKAFFRRIENMGGEEVNAKCTHEFKQKSAYFFPTYSPSLSAKPAMGFSGVVIWEDFARAKWSSTNGGVYASWTYGMGLAGGGSAMKLPGGYMGAQMHSPTWASVIFSVWDGDRSLGSGSHKEFKASKSLVWPLTDRKGLRRPNENSVICRRNCQDCGLQHLRPLKAKGFTTGTQCVMVVPEMVHGGRWELKMRRLRTGVVIDTKDYQGMPKAHAAVNEFDRKVVGAEWQVLVEGVTHLGTTKEIEVGRLLFEGDGDMGLVRLNMFDELLGCNKCDDVYHKVTRVGPFLPDGRQPVGMTWSHLTYVDDPKTPEKPCKRARVSRADRGNHSFTFEAGPPLPQDASLTKGKKFPVY
mmetsp:Transcript_161878/g.295503  ORF Transcript_161878/g.295503 Transcript_161878/m.295503 type:complete len:517 (+) Transcript_161878:110-1660(+)